MMRTKFSLLLLLLLLLLLQSAFSQSTCPPNLDIESGDFSNWECFIGTTAVVDTHNVINLTPSPPVPGRHEIISASGTNTLDPYGNFPRLCPYGGKYSVKLGNDQTGNEAEGMSYTFTVPTILDTFTFTYFYAVVFEDPSHAHYEQPRFFVTAYDVVSGEVVNCASYDYVSSSSIPGFEVSTVRPGVLFKNWTPASLQFAGMKGRTVRLEFKTADCTLGGHFGYAYLDVASACSNILATAPYCIETNSLLLNAPYGFKTYTWYNHDYSVIVGNQQSITLSPPPATTGNFNVDVIPYPGFGCRDTFQAVVTPLPVPDTPQAKTEYTYCQNQVVPSLTAAALPNCMLLWYTSEAGGIGSDRAPTPSTSVAGVFSFYVSQKILFGCESFRRKITVTVLATPLASYNINAARQCQNGNQFIFTSTSTNRFNSSYTWEFGDGQSRTSNEDSIVNYAYSTSGNFYVKLKVVNDGICSSEKIQAVTVVPKPVAAFDYPAIICEKQTTVALVDRSTVPGQLATIDKWWWNIDGNIIQTKNPASFITNKAGPMPVKLVVATSEGCKSDTNNVIFQIHYRPSAAFKSSTPSCDNEIIQITNLSRMPQGVSSEFIMKWNWQFDNSNRSSLQNPGIILTPGVHHARLITETNFGCQSIEADSSIVIYSKPYPRLAIGDSCVNRQIKYMALDSLNTVDKWYWNFGNGFYKAGSLITKTYNRSGSNPLTLITETIEGCKDTIIRPFNIYDNRAFAGKDTIAAKDEPVYLFGNGYPDTKYLWSPSTGLNDPTLANPIATLDKDQIYQLDAITMEGCDSHSEILIKRYKGPELYIPNAFTPDGNGKNDLLKVFPVGIRSFQYLVIYNRNGQIMYRTTDYSQGWNGTFNGKLLDSGTFVAVAHAIDYKGKVLMKKQPVILLR